MNTQAFIFFSLLVNFCEIDACVVNDQRLQLRTEFEIMKTQATKSYDAWKIFEQDFVSCKGVVPDCQLACFCHLTDCRPRHCQNEESFLKELLEDMNMSNDDIKFFVSRYKRKIAELQEALDIVTNRLVELKKKYKHE